MSESLENSSDQTLEERIKASLAQSARDLDADTQQRLNAMRRKALNQATNLNYKPNWFKLNGWIPATSLVFCSVIAVLIFMPSQQSQHQNSALANQTAMLELLENPDELDAMSDPDFYLWVEEVGDEDAA